MCGVEGDRFRLREIQPRNTSLQDCGDRRFSACLVDLDAAQLLDHANAGFHIEEIGEVSLLHIESVGHKCRHNASEIHL